MNTKEKIKEVFYNLSALEIELLQEAIQNRVYIYSTEIKMLSGSIFNPVENAGKTLEIGSQSYDLADEEDFNEFKTNYIYECKKNHDLLSVVLNKLEPLFELISELEHEELKSKFD